MRVQLVIQQPLEILLRPQEEEEEEEEEEAEEFFNNYRFRGWRLEFISSSCFSRAGAQASPGQEKARLDQNTLCTCLSRYLEEGLVSFPGGIQVFEIVPNGTFRLLA